MKRTNVKTFAMLKSVMALKAAFRELDNRDEGVPGMMLMFGLSGSGKTTATQHVCNDVEGIYIRAMATDTAVSFLGRLVRSCGQVPNSTRGNAPMVEQIAEYLRDNERPLFIDEADHLIGSKKIIETVRDIHDLSATPIVLIGHKGIEKRFSALPQIARRISNWLLIPPADLEDAAILAKSCCDVKVDDELLKDLYIKCNGGLGFMMVGLSKIQQFAKANGHSKMTLEQWGDRRKYFVNQSTLPSA